MPQRTHGTLGPVLGVVSACSGVVYTCALKGLQYHKLGACAYTIKLRELPSMLREVGSEKRWSQASILGICYPSTKSLYMYLYVYVCM